MKKKTNRGTLVTWIVIVVILLVLNVPWPVHKELTGIMIKMDDSEFCEEVSIELDGSYYVNFLKEDEYWGYFRLSNDKMTQNEQVAFNLSIGADYEEDLSYRFYEKENPWEFAQACNELGAYESGRLLSKRFLRKICIEVPDYVENGYGIYDGIEERTGYMIVTGVSNYKEAMNRIDACYSDIVFMPEHVKEWPNRVKFSHKIHTS